MPEEPVLLSDIAEAANRLRRATLKMHEAKRDLQEKVAMWQDEHSDSIDKSIAVVAGADADKERKREKKRQRVEADAARAERATRVAASDRSSSQLPPAPPEVVEDDSSSSSES